MYFKYKNSDTVLRNINLQIMRGQKIAIVGENGAGKSTLLNIIMGLYRQSEGEICVNDKSYDFIDIKNFITKLLLCLSRHRYMHLVLETMFVCQILKG